MDTKLLLAKSLTLLYRESQLKEKVDNSADLVRTVVESLQLSDIGIGVNSDRETLTQLKDTVLEMCCYPQDHEYIESELLQRIKLNTSENEKLYEAIEQGIKGELTEAQIKRIVLSGRKSINTHFREAKIADILNKASYAFKFQRDKIKDIGLFLSELNAQLEPLQSNFQIKDPAVLDDVDIGDNGSMINVFNVIKGRSGGGKVYKLGFEGCNQMFQGGLRRGEFVFINALQHKYKTGFTLSLFKQIALYNKPFTENPSKKPLLLRISFEDDLASNLQFLYQSLMYDETRQYVDTRNVSVEDMSNYVKTRLQVNGFHIKLIRVDPTQWSYRSICNKVLELEAQGYNVEVLMLDYLAMVPTVGCTCTGPTGTDLRDLFRRIRNFFASRLTTVITPHQLSSDAKQLLRTGMPEDQFVKEIAEKGYFSGSKQLDQEVDLEVYIHLFKHKGSTYLAVQRGKHRIPTILSNDDYKYFLMKFPKGMPLPDDREGEINLLRKLPSGFNNNNDDMFSI